MNIQQIVDESKATITKSDLAVLLRVLEPMNIQYVIDIGTYHGGSVETWVKAFNPYKLVTIEIKLKELFHKNMVIEYPQCNYLWGCDSTNPTTLDKIREIIPVCDFLFIDGYHTYANVRRDFEMYSPLVKKGGVVVLHDTYPLHYEIQVKPFFEELKAKHNYLEIKTDQYSTGMGVIFI